MLKIFSKGIAALPNLEAFLEEELKLYSDPLKPEAAAGWGHKATADKARAYAQEHKIPYIALEDGFYRSLDLGVHQAAPLSLTVDPDGCYYDASSPSLIEKLMLSDDWFDQDLKARSQRLIDWILRENLSKYNCSPDFEIGMMPEDFSSSKNLLILDQCAGDASLALGMADENVGSKMLSRALELYPDHTIYIKSHPDVIAGKRMGLFDKQMLKASSKIRLISFDVSSISLVKHFKAVFTATSQAGFEALLAGCSVRVFGMPFYAGYGLTLDEKQLARRSAAENVSVEKLFAAACLKAARYVNPIKGQRTSLEDTLELLSLQKRINDENRHHSVVLGVKRWKRPILSAYLNSVGKQVLFTSSCAKALHFAQKKQALLVQWASKEDPGLKILAASKGIKTLGIEDGFLRSQGLGCNHARPFSLVFDRLGIYYDPSRASELEEILNSLPLRSDRDRLAERARSLRSEILKGRLTKYNVGSEEQERLEAFKSQLPADKKVILVPGQVEDDASVRRAGGSIKSNLELLKAVRADNPQAFIVYKPHPDVLALNRKGRIEGQSVMPHDLEVRDISIGALYDLVDEVHVLTSQSGFEALLREIPVTVYGMPFYAGWGLTHDFMRCSRRKSHLSLDELTAGVLILYPRYFDWCTMMFMRPEDAVFRLQHMGRVPKDSLLVRSARAFYGLRRAVHAIFSGDK